jgi:cystathionine beta-lyase/cystathionine gamma-synthase
MRVHSPFYRQPDFLGLFLSIFSFLHVHPHTYIISTTLQKKVICFTTGSYERSRHIVSMAANTGVFKITVSFGSVNSFISLPGDMSHASIPSEVLMMIYIEEYIILCVCVCL